MQTKQSEDLAIQSFTRHSENTMNSVVTNSVGIALLKLAKIYFSNKKNNELEGLFLIVMNEIKEKGNDTQLAACNHLHTLALEPINRSLDILNLYFQDKPDSKGKNIFHEFPLKNVITLIWLAINDDSQYECYLNLDFIEGETEDNYQERRQEAIEKNYQYRLDSFYNCLERLHADRICHHGTRNDLVFLLNKSYPGINLIEDAKSTIFFVLKEKLTELFVNQYQLGKSETKQQLLKALIAWLSNNDCSPFSQLVDPDNSLLKYFQLLFIEHGSDYKKLNLETQINQAMTNISFACDPKAYPALYYLQLIFQVFTELPNQINQQNALLFIKQWIINNADLMNESHVNHLETFCIYNESHAAFIKYQFLLTITGQFSDLIAPFIKEIEEYFEVLANRQELPNNDLSDTHRQLKNQLFTDLECSKRNNFSDHIENFFYKWFDQSQFAEELTKTRQHLYPLLLTPEFQDKIFLSNKAITSLLQSHVEGFLDLSSYEINRVFLHAISISPKDWSLEFGGKIAADSSLLEGGLFSEVLAFVTNQFNGNNERLALQLKKESYPQVLLNQLTYLQKIYREKMWDELSEDEKQQRDVLDINEPINRPDEMIIIPSRMQTAKDWLKITDYLFNSKETWEKVYQVYRVNINRLLALNIDLDLFKPYLSTIPDPFLGSFLAQAASKIAKHIKNSEGLTSTLYNLQEQNQIILIQSMAATVKFVIQNGQELENVLIELPESSKTALMEILGDSIKTMIRDSSELICVFKILPQPQKVLLIKTLNERINLILKNGSELINLLVELPKSSRAVLMEILGDSIKTIIRNSSDLIFVFKILPKPQKVLLIKTLDECINLILKDGNVLVHALDNLRENDKVTFINALAHQSGKIIQTSDQLKNTLDMLPESARIKLIELLSEDIKTIIKNGSELANVLVNLNENAKEALIKTLGSTVKSIILNGWELICVLRALPKPQQILLIKTLDECISLILYDGNVLAHVLDKIESDVRVTLMDTLANKSRTIIKNSDQLKNTLIKLPESAQIKLMALLSKDINTLIKNSWDLADVLVALPESSNLALMVTLGPRVKTIISEVRGLVYLFETLPKSKRILLMETFDEPINLILKDGKALVEVLDKLGEDDRVSLMDTLGNQSRNIIQTGSELKNTLIKLPESSRIKLMELLSEDIKTIIKYGYELADVLVNLPENSKVALMGSLGSTVKTIISTHMGLLCVFEALPKTQQILLIQTLDEDINLILKDGAYLVYMLTNLEKKDNKETLMKALGAHINTIIQNKEQLQKVTNLFPNTPSLIEQLNQKSEATLINLIQKIIKGNACWLRFDKQGEFNKAVAFLVLYLKTGQTDLSELGKLANFHYYEKRFSPSFFAPVEKNNPTLQGILRQFKCEVPNLEKLIASLKQSFPESGVDENKSVAFTI
jgi:hypothetical protein